MLFIRSFSPFYGMVLIMDEKTFSWMYIHPLDAPSPTPGRSIWEARMNADVGTQGKKSLRIAEECVTIDPHSSGSQAIKHQMNLQMG